MSRRPFILHFTLSLTLTLLTMVAPAGAQKKKNAEKTKDAGEPAVLWHDPGAVASLNMIYGIGGQADAPNPAGKFTFLQEDMEGTSPKFDVTDDQGIRWRVKMGQEPQSETAATRLLWAAGYFVDEDYYVPELQVAGLPKLRRGQQFVSGNGIVRGARLERKVKEIKKLGAWDWFRNPFIGTKEFNGLRVMMSLVNNWDLKEVNNSIYEVDGERRYVVSDVGATFGKTGSPTGRSKSNLKDYVDSKFIARKNARFVDFVLHSRPLIFAAVDAPNYKVRSRMEKITKHIPRADARWLGQRLAMLSPEQVRDCFRAAGYTPEEVAAYAQTMSQRIAELNGL